MSGSRKTFAIHPGEILKTEFMEPMGLSAYELAKGLNFPGIYEVVRGDRAMSADTAIRLGKYFGLRLAQGSGFGKGIKPHRTDHRTETSAHAGR